MRASIWTHADRSNFIFNNENVILASRCWCISDTHSRRRCLGHCGWIWGIKIRNCRAIFADEHETFIARELYGFAHSLSFCIVVTCVYIYIKKPHRHYTYSDGECVCAIPWRLTVRKFLPPFWHCNNSLLSANFLSVTREMGNARHHSSLALCFC